MSKATWKLAFLLSALWWSFSNIFQSSKILETFSNSGYQLQPKCKDEPFIDAVFTYVNGSDPFLIREYERHGRPKDHRSRSRDIGQLKYAMRSVLMHAPYVRNFIVVVDNKETQVPNWLDPSHPRVRVIELSEIWDIPANLPSFNSAAIEWAVDNIPGLSQRYLQFCDDYVLWQDLDLHTIYPNDDHYVLWEAWYAPRSEKMVKDAYGKSLAYMYQRLDKKFGKETRRRVGSHVPLLVNKEITKQIKSEFRSEIEIMYFNKPFRGPRDVQFQFTYQQYIRHNFPHYYAPPNHVHFTGIGNNVTKNNKTFAGLENEPRQFVALNDGFGNDRRVSEEVLDQAEQFYEKHFPTRGPWEK